MLLNISFKRLSSEASDLGLQTSNCLEWVTSVASKDFEILRYRDSFCDYENSFDFLMILLVLEIQELERNQKNHYRLIKNFCSKRIDSR